MQKISSENSKYILVRIIREFIHPYRKKLFVAIFCMMIVGMTTAIHVRMIRPTIDEIFLKRNDSALVTIPLIILGISLVKAVADYIQNYLMKYIGQSIVCDVQLKLFRKIIEADLKDFVKESGGKMISRFANDILVMRGSISFLLTSIANRSITIISLIILMFQNSFILSIITFILFPITIIPIIIMSKKMRVISEDQQEKIGLFTGELDETFNAIKIVKSYQNEEYEINKANVTIRGLFKLYERAAKIYAIASPIIEVLSGIGIGFILWYGGTQVMNNVISPGSIFSFVAAFGAAYKPIKALASLNNSFQEGLIASKRIFQILDRKSEKEIKHSDMNLEITEGKIEFKNVSFSYDEKIILNNLSLLIPANKKIALVGESGGGKSTIINLLLRFYEAETGEILIDGQDISKHSIESLRNNISLVSQDIMLFNSNLYENIAYGLKNISNEKIIEVAKLANAHHFIEKLPNGYESLIGHNGYMLSGGQRQRISLARAFLRDSKILLLDEATSSLDPISETKIQESLKTLKNRTIIVVAHRLSSIIDADIIYVVSEGRIIEFGSHTELLSKEGLYHSLYDQQSFSNAATNQGQ